MREAPLLGDVSAIITLVCSREIWGAHKPYVLSLAPRQRAFLVEQQRHFGEAPKWARDARALPGMVTARYVFQCYVSKLVGFSNI
jgi:hypothetical protein